MHIFYLLTLLVGIATANICKPLGNTFASGFDNTECSTIVISADFTLTEEAQEVLNALEELRLQGNAVVTVADAVIFPCKIVIEKDAQITIKQQQLTLSNALVIENNAVVTLPDVQTSKASVEIAGKMIAPSAKFSDDSRVVVKEKGSIETTQQDLTITDTSKFVTEQDTVLTLTNNFVAKDHAEVVFGERTNYFSKNQLQVNDNATMVVGDDSKIIVEGYYLQAMNNARITFGKKTVVECNNLYAYMNSIVTFGEACSLKADNIFMFQESQVYIKDNAKIKLETALSSYSVAHLEIGNNVDFVATQIYALFNTTTKIGDGVKFTLASFETGGYSVVTMGKNVYFDISGDKLSRTCGQTGDKNFCYAIIIRGASTLSFDIVKDQKPIFNVAFGNVLVWNTTSIINTNEEVACYDLTSFKTPFRHVIDVEKEEYSLMCGKKLGRYCKKDTPKEIKEDIHCEDGLYHCPCENIEIVEEVKTEL